MDHRPINGALGEDQASVLLAAVEQQLTRYFASISRQVEAIKVTNAEALAHQQVVNAEYQEALRAALEERLTAFAHHQHERLCAVEEQLGSTSVAAAPSAPAIDSQALQGLAQQFLSKIDGTERQLVDRLLQLEARINHEQGTRVAELETTVGRIGAGFDESVGAMSQRVLALDTKLHELTARVDQLAHEMGRAGAADLDELRTKVGAALTDASVARAEVERIAGAVSKQLDHHASRLAELESRAADELDVDAAVQAERLDELERQMLRLSGTSSGAVAIAAPATVVTAPAAVDLGASLSATIANTMANTMGAATPSATAPVTVAPLAPVTAPTTPAPSSAAPAEVRVPTLPQAVASEPAPLQFTGVAPTLGVSTPSFTPAAPTTSAPAPGSLELDPDVWASVDVPAAPEEPFQVAGPIDATQAQQAAIPATGAMPTTRTVTAPPPMTLVPKLPSARTVTGNESVSDELARLLAR